MQLYEIRLCKKDEYDQLKSFFHDYWSADHIFVKDKSIFEFQHGKAENGYYDYVVAVHKPTGEFHGILGFIRSSLYDGRDFDRPQAIYGALWKVRDDVKNNDVGKLGLGLLFYLIEMFPDSSYITLGLSKYSQRIYSGLHFNFDKMEHYYIANDKLSAYQIISNPRLEHEGKSDGAIELRSIENTENIQNTFFPDKNEEYIRNRYLNHPMYHYELIGIYKEKKLVCIWVIRKIMIEDAACIRIVDMVGALEGLGNILECVRKLLVQHDAEYIDCYNCGIASEQFYQLGFRKVEGDTIVPNYFEPFERVNVDIYYAYYSKQDVIIFKGDGDQDRPSIN